MSNQHVNKNKNNYSHEYDQSDDKNNENEFPNPSSIDIKKIISNYNVLISKEQTEFKSKIELQEFDQDDYELFVEDYRIALDLLQDLGDEYDMNEDGNFFDIITENTVAISKIENERIDNGLQRQNINNNNNDKER